MAATAVVLFALLAVAGVLPAGLRRKGAVVQGAAAAGASGPLDVLTAARLAATERGEVMLAVANLRAVMAQLPTLLLSLRMIPTGDISGHLVVEVDSAPALQACKRIHSLCVVQPELAGKGALPSNTADYDSPNYWDLNWISIRRARQLLDLGYTVLNTDVDVALMQNPFDAIRSRKDSSSADVFAARDGPHTHFCLGFVMFRPTPASKAVLDQMMQMRAAQQGGSISEQALFNQLISSVKIGHLEDEAFLSYCRMLSIEGKALPDQIMFAVQFTERLKQQPGGLRRLFGIHMNCCSINDERGSKLPPDCKLAALPALLQWHALYIEDNAAAVAG